MVSAALVLGRTSPGRFVPGVVLGRTPPGRLTNPETRTLAQRIYIGRARRYWLVWCFGFYLQAHRAYDNFI